MTVLNIGPKEQALRALREQRAKAAEKAASTKVVSIKAKKIGKVVSIKGSKRGR